MKPSQNGGRNNLFSLPYFCFLLSTFRFVSVRFGWRRVLLGRI
jgi:hypothetical protein